MAAVYCLLWAGLEYIDWEICYFVYQIFIRWDNILRIMNKWLKNIKVELIPFLLQFMVIILFGQHGLGWDILTVLLCLSNIYKMGQYKRL